MEVKEIVKIQKQNKKSQTVLTLSPQSVGQKTLVFQPQEAFCYLFFPNTSFEIKVGEDYVLGKFGRSRDGRSSRERWKEHVSSVRNLRLPSFDDLDNNELKEKDFKKHFSEIKYYDLFYDVKTRVDAAYVKFYPPVFVNDKVEKLFGFYMGRGNFKADDDFWKDFCEYHSFTKLCNLNGNEWIFVSKKNMNKLLNVLTRVKPAVEEIKLKDVSKKKKKVFVYEKFFHKEENWEEFLMEFGVTTGSNRCIKLCHWCERIILKNLKCYCWCQDEEIVCIDCYSRMEENMCLSCPSEKECQGEIISESSGEKSECCECKVSKSLIFKCDCKECDLCICDECVYYKFEEIESPSIEPGLIKMRKKKK